MKLLIVTLVGLVVLAACSSGASAPVTITETVVSTTQVTTTVATTASVPPVTVVEVGSTIVAVTSTSVETETKTKTVKVTATVEPKRAKASNGDYMVGADIKPGTWQCKRISDHMYWVTKTKSGDIIDNDLGSIARVPAEAYVLSLQGCQDEWVRVD